MNTPWEGNDHIDKDHGGWDTIAPSAIAFGGKLNKVPEEMTRDDIARVHHVAPAQVRVALGRQNDTPF